jgi:hypothetical protein
MISSPAAMDSVWPAAPRGLRDHHPCLGLHGEQRGIGSSSEGSQEELQGMYLVRSCTNSTWNGRRPGRQDDQPAIQPPPRCLSAPGTKPPAQSVSRAVASQRAPAGRTKSRDNIGPGSPTTTKGSRAGSFQGVGGSGQKDTCVAQGSPSQTGVVIFPSAEVSSHT